LGLVNSLTSYRLAWLLDHDARSYELIARAFAGQEKGLTRDDILDNITLYWLTVAPRNVPICFYWIL
jgi:hypothetical protein